MEIENLNEKILFLTENHENSNKEFLKKQVEFIGDLKSENSHLKRKIDFYQNSQDQNQSKIVSLLEEIEELNNRILELNYEYKS